MEEALIGLHEIFEQDFPKYLREVELEYTDGVELENLRDIVWEEYEDGVGMQVPGLMMIADEETDPSLRDILFDARLTCIFLVQDTNKRNVTKKMFRYAKALRRMLKPTANRSLRGKVNSAKVVTIRYLPTGRGGSDTDAIYARGFEADLVLRLPKEKEG
jgi:hypothetical protein